MASSAAVSCKAAVNAARLGSRSKSGVPKMAVRAPRRSAVSISATMAGDDDFVVPAAAPPPPQVFNAASIKVRPGHPRSRAHRARPSANISLHEGATWIFATHREDAPPSRIVRPVPRLD